MCHKLIQTVELNLAVQLESPSHNFSCYIDNEVPNGVKKEYKNTSLHHKITNTRLNLLLYAKKFKSFTLI